MMKRFTISNVKIHETGLNNNSKKFYDVNYMGLDLKNTVIIILYTYV